MMITATDNYILWVSNTWLYTSILNIKSVHQWCHYCLDILLRAWDTEFNRFATHKSPAGGEGPGSIHVMKCFPQLTYNSISLPEKGLQNPKYVTSCHVNNINFNISVCMIFKCLILKYESTCKTMIQPVNASIRFGLTSTEQQWSVQQ